MFQCFICLIFAITNQERFSIIEQMGRNHKYTRILALGLVVLFATYYASIARYAHVHIVDGVIVVHSHPFHIPHSHPAGQTFHLSFITSIESFEAGTPVLIQPDLHLLGLCLDNHTSRTVPAIPTGSICLRAPPSSIFFI